MSHTAEDLTNLSEEALHAQNEKKRYVATGNNKLDGAFMVATDLMDAADFVYKAGFEIMNLKRPEQPMAREYLKENAGVLTVANKLFQELKTIQLKLLNLSRDVKPIEHIDGLPR